MRFVLTRPAQQDIAAIGSWIARDNPTRAVRFAEQIRTCCRDIGQIPEGFRVDPDFIAEDVRRRPFGRYVIFYRIEQNCLVIFAVLHAARDTTAILHDRLR